MTKRLTTCLTVEERERKMQFVNKFWTDPHDAKHVQVSAQFLCFQLIRGHALWAGTQFQTFFICNKSYISFVTTFHSYIFVFMNFGVSTSRCFKSFHYGETT